MATHPRDLSPPRMTRSTSDAEAREEGRGLPPAMRNLVDEPLALRRPAAQAGHVGLRPA
jgi:hypothetical protein